MSSRKILSDKKKLVTPVFRDVTYKFKIYRVIINLNENIDFRENLIQHTISLNTTKKIEVKVYYKCNIYRN